MAVDPNATRRQRVLDSLADGTTRTWTTGNGASQTSYTVANPQLRVLGGVQVFSIELTVSRGGVVWYDDRINMPNPATIVIDSRGRSSDNPLQALRDTMLTTVDICTKGFTVKRLERNPDGTFKGDTLSVRAGTTDGDVSSQNATFATMCTGSSLSAFTTGTTTTPRWSFTGALYQGRESFFEYDTSTIGASSTISAAVYTFYGSGTAETDSADNYNLDCRYKDWGGTVTTADWFDPRNPTWNALPAGGTFDVGSWVQTAGTANNFSDSGVYTSIAKTGTTRIVLGYSGMNSSTPANINEVEIRTADVSGTTSDPLLTVTYTPAVNVTITSVAATATASANNPVPLIAPTSVKSAATASATSPGTNLATASAAATATTTATSPVPKIEVPLTAATASADAPAPSRASGTSAAVTSVAATSTADTTSPGVSLAEGSVAATTATADGGIPTPSIGRAPDSIAATATATANSPGTTLALGSTASTATGVANTPGTSLSQPTTAATASSTATSPTPGVSVSPSAAAASAQANAPGTSLAQPTTAATASASATTPTPKLSILSSAATVVASAAAPSISIVAWALLTLNIAKNFLVSLVTDHNFTAALGIARSKHATEVTTETYSAALVVAHAYEVELVMSNTVCYVGNSIVVTGTFKNSAGTATDPSTITAKTEAPGGVVTSYVYGVASEVAKSSTGVYTLTFTPDAAGPWIVQFAGTGNAIAVNQDTFQVLTAI